MSIDSNYKNNLAAKLSHRLGLAIQNGEMPGAELEDACNMILSAIETMSTEEEVIALFDKLSMCWPFFQELVDAEEASKSSVNSITERFTLRNSSA